MIWANEKPSMAVIQNDKQISHWLGVEYWPNCSKMVISIWRGFFHPDSFGLFWMFKQMTAHRSQATISIYGVGEPWIPTMRRYLQKAFAFSESVFCFPFGRGVTWYWFNKCSHKLPKQQVHHPATQKLEYPARLLRWKLIGFNWIIWEPWSLGKDNPNWLGTKKSSNGLSLWTDHSWVRHPHFSVQTTGFFPWKCEPPRIRKVEGWVSKQNYPIFLQGLGFTRGT